MESLQDTDDADQLARNQAALVAQARAQEVADRLIVQHAEREYDTARQRAASRVPTGPRRPGRLQEFGPPPEPPRINDAVGEPGPPPPSFATDTATVLTAADGYDEI